jgi:hypothetical protein
MEIGKPGPGRPKGAKNKRTKAVEAAVAAAGITPLEFMLNVLQDDLAPLDDRKWAAQNAAPYVHAKLSSVDMKAEVEATIEEVRHTIVKP